jgi:hypothetical protein
VGERVFPWSPQQDPDGIKITRARGFAIGARQVSA